MSAPEKSRTDKRSIRPKVRIGDLPGATVLLRGSEHQDQWRARGPGRLRVRLAEASGHGQRRPL